MARRRFMTLRPPGVAIRARNPCFFLRRRLFGWKVRFMIRNEINCDHSFLK